MTKTVNLFWWRWLIGAAIFTLLFGLALIVLPQPMQAFFTRIVFGTPDLNALMGDTAARYITLIFGIVGAVMVAWMVLLLYVLFTIFRRGRREGWMIITLSVLTWYVLDSGFSLVMGFAVNVALNTVFLLLFMIPLGATVRHFYDD